MVTMVCVATPLVLENARMGMSAWLVTGQILIMGKNYALLSITISLIITDSGTQVLTTSLHLICALSDL